MRERHVAAVEVCFFKFLTDLFFVLFCYMEYEGAESVVFVFAVLAPCGCSADADDDTRVGFADFYG